MKSEISKPNASSKDMERLFDSAGWGLFFLWIGIAVLAQMGWGVGILGFGLISLGMQIARVYSNLPVNRFGLILALCFVVTGALQVFNIQIGKTPMEAYIVPGLFIIAGVTILLSLWLRKSP